MAIERGLIVAAAEGAYVGERYPFPVALGLAAVRMGAPSSGEPIGLGPSPKLFDELASPIIGISAQNCFDRGGAERRAKTALFNHAPYTSQWRVPAPARVVEVNLAKSCAR